ncbi:PPA1309 family protein [Spirillospora sp. CA-142024]|uniref:PPA1309 family protein n=1 Tax=Spirillospora sp. CA-142024 TaxID=3240036 RepID=UPI003D8AA397
MGAIQEREKLRSAVLTVERHLAEEGWGKLPRLFALADRERLIAAEPQLAAEVEAAPPGTLVPVAQSLDDLAEPPDVLGIDEALARIRWPGEVVGCVLSRRILVLPKAAREGVEQDVTAAARHPEGRIARLTVGVLRDGTYASCLRLRVTDELLEDTEAADGLVAALLSTF